MNVIISILYLLLHVRLNINECIPLWKMADLFGELSSEESEDGNSPQEETTDNIGTASVDGEEEDIEDMQSENVDGSTWKDDVYVFICVSTCWYVAVHVYGNMCDCVSPWTIGSTM